MMDGQNLFDEDHTDGYGGWEVTDAVESMMSNGGRGVIIVGIDNSSGNRDSELTPDLGDVKPEHKKDFSNRTGEQFSDFVVNTVMPYVQKNYNSSKAARDNIIAGSSSGGLEAFYIGMEHSDKFGHIGSLSPAYLLFDENVWNNYLKKFDFTSASTPKLYIYNGGNNLEKDLLPDILTMYDRLKDGGWDSSKLKLILEEGGDHNESWWRIIFPECLTWLLAV
jgi:enterochelin esterase-like enzyme